MIAKLEFTLPEEATEHLLAIHAPDLLGVIEEFTNWLRGERKHGALSPEAEAFANRAWDRLHHEFQAHGVGDLV